MGKQALVLKEVNPRSQTLICYSAIGHSRLPSCYTLYRRRMSVASFYARQNRWCRCATGLQLRLRISLVKSRAPENLHEQLCRPSSF
jgi:hypothetical protein